MKSFCTLLLFSALAIAGIKLLSGVCAAESEESETSDRLALQLPWGGSLKQDPGSAAITPTSGPHFIAEASRNVTALAGKVATLNCRIKNLDNWTVSWIRHRDVHLLTVGPFAYTADQRFRVGHRAVFDDANRNRGDFVPLDSYQDWSLEIHSSQPRDSGIYECQISTTPHRSLFLHLRVVEPSTTIISGSEVFVDKGSTINLTCVIRLSPEPPTSIQWLHNNQVIGYDSVRGGISVVTEKGSESSSSLLIQNARSSDSGKYTCRPENADPATVNVHVLNGESPAAMQHGSSSSQARPMMLFLVALGLGLSACMLELYPLPSLSDLPSQL